MTVTITDNTKRSNGDGVTDVFLFTFRVLENARRVDLGREHVAPPGGVEPVSWSPGSGTGCLDVAAWPMRLRGRRDRGRARNRPIREPRRVLIMVTVLLRM